MVAALSVLRPQHAAPYSNCSGRYKSAGLVPYLVRRFCVLMMLSAPFSISAQEATAQHAVVVQQLVEDVYQPRHRHFRQATQRFLEVAKRSCKERSDDSVFELRDQFASLLVAYSGIELYKIGPLLEDNRQNRLFFWPDKHRVVERRLSVLLADSDSTTINGYKLSGKSVALQGLPAVERLLFGKDARKNFAADSPTPDCQIVTAIAQNMHSMAIAIDNGWNARSELVESMLVRIANSRYFRTEDEVLSSILTQILEGIDVVRNQKIAPLAADEVHVEKAPLWLSKQTMPMIKSNVDSLRALVIDTGLAAIAGLEDELSFEFRTANDMLQALLELRTIVEDDGQLNDKARSLIRSLATVVEAIDFTLNDRFKNNPSISAAFNSMDGD